MVDIIEKINDAINIDYNATGEQRDQADEDIRFVDVPGGMWEDLFPQFFEGDNRPKMEFNKVHQSVYRAVGEWVTSRFRVKYRPEGNSSSEKDATLLNGLYCKDERRSNGFEAYDTAVEEMFKCGIGHWKLGTEFVDEEDPDSDEQRVIFEPIFSSFNMVMWDASAKRYDKADARHCTLLHRMTKESFEAQWPEHSVDSVTQPYDRSVFNWNNSQNIFVAEFYEIIKKKEKVFVFENEQGDVKNLWESEVKDVIDELDNLGFDKVKERKKTRKYIEKTVISGSEILEKTVRIAGKLIPIIPVYGFRTAADGQEFYHGLVRNMKDAQRLYNMSVSKLAENAALSGKQVPVFYPDEMEGLGDFWAEHQLGNKPYLLKKPHRDANGQELQHPIEYLQPSPLDGSNVEVLNITSEFIREETGGNPQDTLDPDASGKAINAVQARVDMQTAILFENVAKSMRRCGEVYRHIAADINDKQRFATILKADDTEETLQLFEWVIDEETGKPVEINDITKGDFEVVVDTGPAFASRRRETVDTISQIMQNTDPNSPYMPMLYTVLLDNVDGEGLEDIKAFNRKSAIMQGYKEPETDEEIQMVQQMQQQQNQPDGQEQLIQAAAAQAAAEARERDSKVAVNMTTAAKNQAQTQEILAGIQTDQVKTVQAAEKQQHDIALDRFNTISGAREKRTRLLMDNTRQPGSFSNTIQ